MAVKILKMIFINKRISKYNIQIKFENLKIKTYVP